MQDLKSSPRSGRFDLITYVSISVVILFLLSIFFNRDVKHILSYIDLGLTDSFLVNLLPIPIGIVSVIVLILNLTENVFHRLTVQGSFKVFMAIMLIVVFMCGIIFNNQILIAREFVEFKLHEQGLQQLISISKQASTGCISYVDLPPSVSEMVDHKTMGIINSGNTTWIGLIKGNQERETDFYYIDGQLPKLGSTIGICGTLMECYYQIDNHWFLCTEYSKDI